MTGESTLFYAEVGTDLVICDTRPAAQSAVTVLSELDRLLYLQCDGIADVRGLTDAANAAGYNTTEESIAARLQSLCVSGLMLKEGRRYLALAVRLGAYKPARTARRALRNTIASGQIDAHVAHELLVSVSRKSRSTVERRV
jgi:hypothetical protein